MRQITKTVTINDNDYDFYSCYNTDDDSFRLILTSDLDKEKSNCLIKFNSSTEVILPLSEERHRCIVNYCTEKDMFNEIKVPSILSMKNHGILPDGFTFSVNSIDELRKARRDHESEFLAAEFAYFEAFVNTDPILLDKYLVSLFKKG